jgi:rubrerythrin
MDILYNGKNMKKFQRKKEDFKCEVCGKEVIGNGYTDHCPKCLWGKHVDINPGDRAEKCGGLMEPVGLDQKKGQWVIQYKCQKCGYLYRVKAAVDDDRNEMKRVCANL